MHSQTRCRQAERPRSDASPRVTAGPVRLHTPQADEGSVSRQTGLLASLMNLSSFVTSIPWGLACDRLGRKPVLIIGNFSCALSMVLLGFSSSFGFAAFTRVFGGLMNGVLGAVKTGAAADQSQRRGNVCCVCGACFEYTWKFRSASCSLAAQCCLISPTTPISRSRSAACPSPGVRHHQPACMCALPHGQRLQPPLLRPPTLPGVPAGLGAVLGPTLGGVLARPCSKEGLLGPDSAYCAPGSLLLRFPYALACVTGASFLVLSGARQRRIGLESARCRYLQSNGGETNAP